MTDNPPFSSVDRSPVSDRLRAGLASLNHPNTSNSMGTTSDLSIDEVLLLHTQGWEPAGIVCGVSMFSIYQGAWWGASYDPRPMQIVIASQAVTSAFREASRKLSRECSKVKGIGVVGIAVDVHLSGTHVKVSLIGTAIARQQGNGARTPSKASRSSGDPFLSDLSARDFVLLERAGWEPTGIAYGFSFVSAPRRKATAAIKQASQNVELTMLTTAMYSAREVAFSQLQTLAASQKAHGVVGVSVDEGPLSFARHVMAFNCWGTCVRLIGDTHQKLNPQTVVELDDPEIDFQATSLSG